MKFKDYLQKDLERISCSLSELSKASGLSSAVLSRYRSGERTPRKDSDLLVQLCNGINDLEEKAGLPSNRKNRLSLYKISLSEELMLHYDRFDQLLRILHVSMKDLSRELNYDASYLSRIRSGKRSPADPEQFAANVSRFFIRTAGPKELKEIGNLIQEKNPEHLESSLKTWLLYKQEFRNAPLESFLEKLDSFNLEEFIRVLRFTDFSDSGTPIPIPFKREYHGTVQMRQGELDFFRVTTQNQTGGTVFMCNDMPIEEMAEDTNFAKTWMGMVAACLKNGITLNMIHDVNRSFNEMMIGLQAWIPVYMTGQITPYYIPNTDNSVYHHCLYVSDAAALSGECIHGFHDHGCYQLTTGSDELPYYSKRASDILSHAKPLMSIFRSEQFKEFDEYRNAEFQMPGDRVISSCVPPLATLTNDLLMEILESSDAPEELYATIEQARKKELADLNRSLRKGMMYMRIPDLSKSEFRSYTPLVKMASMFQNIEVPYTWETYQKHIQLTRDFAETTPEFDLVFDQRSAFRNITVYLREDQVAIILKHKSPEIAFVITHPKMVNALQQFHAPFFDTE